MRHVWGGIILSEQGSGQSQGSEEQFPQSWVKCCSTRWGGLGLGVEVVFLAQ